MAPQSLCSLIARRLLGARGSHAISAAAGSGTAIAKALEDTVVTDSQSTSRFTKLQAHRTQLGSGPCLIPVSHTSVGLPSQYQLRLFNTTSSISDRISGGSGKDNRIEFTPISKAVALLVSHDALKDRHRIVTSMSKLCLDMASDIKQYSPTEVAAFCEAAKKLDFCTQALADAVMEYFQGKVDQLSEEELLGVIWVVAKKEDVDSLLARDIGEAVNNHLENLRHEDFPDMLVLISSLCPASPFLLTALSDEALSRLQEFSQAEVCALVNAFGTEIVRRSLFDDRIFKELATHVIKNVRDFTQTELRSVLAVYRDVCPRRHSLVPTLALMEDELAPYTSPSPQ